MRAEKVRGRISALRSKKVGGARAEWGEGEISRKQGEV